MKWTHKSYSEPVWIQLTEFGAKLFNGTSPQFRLLSKISISHSLPLDTIYIGDDKKTALLTRLIPYVIISLRAVPFGYTTFWKRQVTPG